MYNKENCEKGDTVMKHTFSTAERHFITDANYNSYEIPVLHPSRKLNMHDLIYIIDGEWKIGQEGEGYTARKDDVLILGAHLFHYGIEPCSSGTKTMYLHAAWQEGDGVFSESSKTLKPDQLVLDDHISAVSNSEIRKIFEKIIRAKSEHNQVMASSYFDVLLYELRDIALKSQRSNLANDIRHMIISSSDKILKNSEIAQHFSISVKTAENTFKNAYHMTIHQYILKTKIEQAQFCLISFPEMKLFEVAKNLGFYDEYHLSRQFKRICSMTPGEFRKQNRQSL